MILQNKPNLDQVSDSRTILEKRDCIRNIKVLQRHMKDAIMLGEYTDANLLLELLEQEQLKLESTHLS